MLDKQLENCTFAKTVMMMIIVLYHSMMYWWIGSAKSSNVFLSSFAGWLSGFHNYCFFLISGYIYCALKCEKNKYQQYLPFIFQKIKRLVVPAIVIGICWVAPINGLLYHYSMRDIVSDILLAQNPSHLWFLWALFWVFAFFWPLTNFFIHHSFKGLLLVILVYMFSQFGGHYLDINPFSFFNGCYYLYWFYLGFKIRQYKIKNPKWQYLLVASILYTGLLYVNRSLIEDSIIVLMISKVMGLLTSTIGAGTAFFVLQILGERIRWQDSSAIDFFSKRAMAIYLFHQQLIHISQHMIDGKINALANAAINYLFALVLSVSLASMMLHFRITRQIVGERG